MNFPKFLGDIYIHRTRCAGRDLNPGPRLGKPVSYQARLPALNIDLFFEIKIFENRKKFKNVITIK